MRDLANIVIPIYKQVPDDTELVSLEQVLKILNRYPFKIIAPQDLNLDHYESIMKPFGVDYSIHRFDPYYFEGLEGYNQLMLSKKFYELFVDADYILIHQLDVCVFKDELEYWCKQGYDYIGAPWPPELHEPYTTDLRKWRVGNGGFSLRRVQSILKILNYPFPVKSFSLCWRENHPLSFLGKVLKWVTCMARALGYHNTVKYYLKHYPAYEDMFFALCFENTKLKLKKPDSITASRFAVELGVDIIQKDRTEPPFGCHAWQRYRPEYWKQFIS